MSGITEIKAIRNNTEAVRNDQRHRAIFLTLENVKHSPSSGYEYGTISVEQAEELVAQLQPLIDEFNEAKANDKSEFENILKNLKSGSVIRLSDYWQPVVKTGWGEDVNYTYHYSGTSINLADAVSKVVPADFKVLFDAKDLR